MSAYLFVHFVGKEADALSEQVYFSVSRDGKAWELLNNSKPVLTSGIGEGGVRDPFIIKSVGGEKYYLIATDLSIYNRRADKNVWRSCQESGSRDIIVWESADMVNWSEPRAVRIAGEENGCAWAPEAMYDKEKEAYIVYFASTDAADGYKYQRMYRAYT